MDHDDLDKIIACVPPVYKIISLSFTNGDTIEPCIPVQMFPEASQYQCSFKFYGLNNYDVHTAFNTLPDTVSYTHLRAHET